MRYTINMTDSVDNKLVDTTYFFNFQTVNINYIYVTINRIYERILNCHIN